ncbi:MAG: peptidylprolyl isomerase [Candidatus Omnitrophica bacterium]|nr:peptidylprolyl isomerase [Candidatus Omnitrophota bacterium]
MSFAFYILCAAAISSTDTFRVVAVVNDEAITEGEVEELVDLKGNFSSALNYLIEEALLFQEAKKKQIEKERVDEEFNRVKERFSSEEGFYQQLQKEGLTAHQVKKNLEKQLLIQRLVREEVLEKISVTPYEIEERLSQRNFPKKVSYRLSEIFRKEKKEIKEILGRIKKGQLKFETLSTDLGYFQREEMALEFQTVLFTLKIGEISKPIEMEDGYHLISITEKREEERSPEEFRKAIREELFQKKFGQKYKEFIVELKKNAHIEIKNNE